MNTLRQTSLSMGGKDIFNRPCMLSKSLSRAQPSNKALDFSLTLIPEFTPHPHLCLNSLWGGVQSAVWVTELRIPLVILRVAFSQRKGKL